MAKPASFTQNENAAPVDDTVVDTPSSIDRAVNNGQEDEKEPEQTAPASTAAL